MRKPTVEQREAKERLIKWLPKGTTLYTIVRRVSRSGMSRNIQIVYFSINIDKGDPDPIRAVSIQDRHPTHSIATMLGKRTVVVNGHDTIQVNGTGMDMPWHLVAHEISFALHGEVDALKHKPL